MTDVWLKITGPIPSREARTLAALRTLGLHTEMIPKRENGDEFLGSNYNHDVAINYIPNLMTVRGVYGVDGNGDPVIITPPVFDGPHLMIRFVSDQVKAKVRDKIVRQNPPLPDGTPTPETRHPLPAGIEQVNPPTTIVWA